MPAPERSGGAGMTEEHDPIRDEAQRLVAAALAAVSVAANGLTAAHVSTGTPECCICPICRVIAAMRDPSPEVADRLAAGAADLAVGVASMLRSLAAATHRTHPTSEDPDQPSGPDDPARDD